MYNFFNVYELILTNKPNEQRSQRRARRTLTLFEGVVDVEQRQVVSVNVSKAHLGLVCRLLSLRGADKTLWD